MKNFIQKFDFFFPEQNIFKENWSVRAQILLFVILLLGFYLIGQMVPPNGFMGFDWVSFFSHGHPPDFYPPWAKYVSLLSWPMLIGLSLAGIGVSVIKRAIHPLSAIFALLTLPVFWTMFLGQVDGLAVLGVLGLPWLIPFALAKPQVSIFALGARKSYLLAGLIWLAISFLIWGFWPLTMLNAVKGYYEYGRFVQDIGIGWWGIFIALPLAWFSRGDMDMLMVSGTFITPRLLPYNMLPLIPAIARLSPVYALIACVLTWFPLLANWVGPIGWWFGWLFVIWLWATLARNRYMAQKIKPLANSEKLPQNLQEASI